MYKSTENYEEIVKTTLDLKDPSIPGTIQGAARRAENFRLTHFRMTFKKGTV